MPTRLSRFAEGIMEAAWLAAIIVVPVFFNVYSSRIFEPDKITLLRTLALIILAAWLVKLVESGGVRWDSLPHEGKGWRAWLRVPLLAPVAALALVYGISTIFSVTPYASLWGSYQRLQGTYTTFAYLIVFAALAANLRRRAQVERLIGVAILASMPVSLYGILQRYRADPIPWGGDVTQRIAANMGNSIFVAAYLIMVFPLVMMRIVETFEALLQERGSNLANFARATVYIFVLALHGVALYFSGSRGPWLGLAAGFALFWLGLSLVWRQRKMTFSLVGLALAAGVFLVLLNIPNGPLESLRSRPEFGRLGQLLDAESRTGRVRTLIWQGAYELVKPHAPLEYPDGRQDKLNLLRPLIGYGPESMYVAYNRFYQPELTLVEKRNASPDRSHNETWDSLVITGVLGLAAYLTLFGAVIYYALKWLGLADGKRRRNLFLGLYAGSGFLVAAFFWIWRGPAYLGVALPFGMVFGVLAYLIIVAVSIRPGDQANSLTYNDRRRQYLLLALLAAVVAHFVEINFGIAIVATRTYFFVYAALLLLAGYILPLHGEYATSPVAASSVAAIDDGGLGAGRSGITDPGYKLAVAAIGDGGGAGHAGSPTPAAGKPSSRKKRAAQRAAPPRANALRLPAWLPPALIAGLFVALLLGTLGYEYVSNASRLPTATGLIRESLTTLTAAGGGTSNGLIALLVTTWLAGCILLVSERFADSALTTEGLSTNTAGSLAAWLKAVGVALGVSLLLGALFWLWHAGGLAALNRVQATDIPTVLAQVARSESLLTRYYTFLIALLLGLAFFLPETWPSITARSAAGWVAAPAALGLALILAASTNLRVIQADIAFKTAEVFAQPGTWPVSIQIYDRAIDLAPNEDYYYLFLGRAYLEQAKTIENAFERDQVVEAAARDLKEAQRINPLNTDHTANLARLYSLWAGFADKPEDQSERAKQADAYFAGALALSPMSARLWDERALHVMSYLNDLDAGYEYLQRAVEIDPYYDWTYGLLGDYYARYKTAQPDISEEQKNALLVQASEAYTTAVFRADPANANQMYNYLVSFGGAQAHLGDFQKALEAYQRALEAWPDNPDRWRVEAAMAQLYAQLGDIPTALRYAQQALTTVPADQRQSVEELVRQYGG